MRCEIICQAVHSHSLLPLSGVGEMPRDPDLAAAWEKKLSGRLAVNLSLSAAPEAILIPEMTTGSGEVREKWERGERLSQVRGDRREAEPGGASTVGGGPCR